MIYNSKIVGKYTYLRYVQVEDAEFVLSLRTDPLNARYINDTENDLDLQIEWIKMQQSKANDYYFVICDLDNNRKGLVALYNLDETEKKAEMGRLICPKSPVQLFESVILINDFCFNILGLMLMFVRVNPENAKTLAVTRKMETKFVGYGHYENGIKYMEFQNLGIDWPEAKLRMLKRLDEFVMLINRQQNITQNPIEHNIA